MNECFHYNNPAVLNAANVNHIDAATITTMCLFDTISILESSVN